MASALLPEDDAPPGLLVVAVLSLVETRVSIVWVGASVVVEGAVMSVLGAWVGAGATCVVPDVSPVATGD